MSFAHRDIKPANILFDAANRVKIADFGLSEFLIDANQKINKGEGSIYYVSTEITFKGPYSPFLSDIWAVGVLIYQVFENAYPFQGKCKEEVIQGIRSVDFSTRYSPKMITVIINHTLVFNPKERFSLAKISEILNSMITQHTCKLSTSPPRINSSFWPQQQFIHLPSMKDSASVNGNVIFTTVVSRPRRLTLHSHKPEPLHYIPQVCRSQGPPIMNQCLDDSQSPIRESRLNLEPSELRCISFKQGAAFFTSRR